MVGEGERVVVMVGGGKEICCGGRRFVGKLLEWCSSWS